ncbi:unnamed protein product [Rotaria magnacalcarata]|uniref:F-box domain-containing protein n=1 Tax=Rotaria magnacalcarata TaxID=392030 RepID=A0A8S2V4M2_9BILA|nr:unnamed protein product [Rotaria magnacalcarata]
MNQLEIHLLDLPNEILIIILKKLDNIDVLYSLFGINNRRLHTLVQQDVFTNILNFIRISAITDSKLGRYWNNILSPVHDYDSTFQHIVKHQLTDLILHDNDEYLYSPLPSVRSRNVYSDIFALFENLKCLTIVSSSVNNYPPLSVYHQQSTT